LWPCCLNHAKCLDENEGYYKYHSACKEYKDISLKDTLNIIVVVTLGGAVTIGQESICHYSIDLIREP
jgi:hypothetical protein